MSFGQKRAKKAKKEKKGVSVIWFFPCRVFMEITCSKIPNDTAPLFGEVPVKVVERLASQRVPLPLVSGTFHFPRRCHFS
jgi:hypothetical protein